MERAIHRFKYEGWRTLAVPLAELMAERLGGEVGPDALLLSVPLHPSRAWTRGYDQAELLAAELRRLLPSGRARGRLVRLRNTPSQVGLDRIDRRANVAGAFGWRGPAPKGDTVVLIDDVATTGATLESCASAARAAGAVRVTALTVARALR